MAVTGTGTEVAGAAAGGCLCGKVRFAIDAAPVSSRLCWCRDCQYWAAGSATFNVLFPADKLRVTGEIHWHDNVAASGNRMKRGFCPQCGTPLFSTSDPLPADGNIRVRAGALDDPEILPPQAVIWASSAPAWVCHDPALPIYARQPPVPGADES